MTDTAPRGQLPPTIARILSRFESMGREEKMQALVHYSKKLEPLPERWPVIRRVGICVFLLYTWATGSVVAGVVLKPESADLASASGVAIAPGGELPFEILGQQRQLLQRLGGQLGRWRLRLT